jgi:DNA-directed RNA polymerase subunit K/omega
VLTKYERTKIIGLRAEQLVRDAQPFVEIEAGRRFDPYEVAERELMGRRLPFVIVRHMPDGKVEQVRLEDVALEY